MRVEEADQSFFAALRGSDGTGSVAIGDEVSILIELEATALGQQQEAA